MQKGSNFFILLISKESEVLSVVIELLLKHNMSTENSKPDFNIPLT